MILKILYSLFMLFYVILTTEPYIIFEGRYNSVNNKQNSLLNVNFSETSSDKNGTSIAKNASEIFNGVYVECVLLFSFTCIQRRTLDYLHKLNDMKEISVIGDFVKFVKTDRKPNLYTKINTTNVTEPTSEELSRMIDKAVDAFFDSHMLSLTPDDNGVGWNGDDFVGRKKMKGGDDGGKKKMMMMALMCMKMKMMVVMPAMMGMMGMMSFKGMMFGMMTFFLTKMMLLMKLLEKKGGGFGGGGFGNGVGSDGAWNNNAGGGWNQGGGAGDQSAGGGGYNAAGEWQNRAMVDNQQQQTQQETNSNKQSVQISYATPQIRINRPSQLLDQSSMTPIVVKPSETSEEYANINDEFNNYYKFTEADKMKSRIKRNILISDNDTVHKTNKKDVYRIPKKWAKIKTNDKTYSVINKSIESIPFIYNEPQKIRHNVRTKRDIFDVLQYIKTYFMNRIFTTRINNLNNRVSPITKTRRVPNNRRQTLNLKQKHNIRRKIPKSFTTTNIIDQHRSSNADHYEDSRKHKEKLQEINDIIGENPWI